MALEFICDYCGKHYEADIATNAPGGKFNVIVYQEINKRHTVSKPTDPCDSCEQAAEQAKKEALAKRKQAQ